MRNALLSFGACTLIVGGLWLFLDSEEQIVNYPPKNDRIIAFGDSLVSGVGSSAGQDFISLLSKKLNTPILNLGVPGNTTADGLSRVKSVTAKDPGTVIILLGGNDYLRNIPEDQTFENLRSIINEFQANGSMVVLLGVRGGILSDKFADRFELLAEDTGSIYVPDVLKGLIGNMAYMSDAIHPNDAGYAKIADKVHVALAPYLK